MKTQSSRLMLKSIYGLKQSARAWWQHLDDCLKQIELIRTPADEALWIRRLLFLLGHVDNIIIAGTKKETNETKPHISKRYKIKLLMSTISWKNFSCRILHQSQSQWIPMNNGNQRNPGLPTSNWQIDGSHAGNQTGHICCLQTCPILCSPDNQTLDGHYHNSEISTLSSFWLLNTGKD